MKIKIRKYFIVIPWLFTTVQANIYYVSSSASSTNWNQAQNTGTPCSPITAMNNAKAGDTVYFHGGTYGTSDKRVWYSPVHSGVEGAEILFRACPGDTKPLIMGTLAIKEKQWLRCSGLTFQGNKPPPVTWKDMPSIVIDDSSIIIPPRQRDSLGMRKIHKKYSTYMAWYENMFRKYSIGIFVSGSSHVTISDNMCYYYSAGIQFSNNDSMIIAENNILHHCLVGIFSQSDTSIASVKDALVRGNYCFQNMNEGICIAYGAKRVLIENNRCEYSAISHIDSYLYTTDVTIRGNTVSYGGYYAETMTWPGPSGIDVGLGVTGLVIENNYIAYQMDITGGDGMGVIIDRNDERRGTSDTIRNNLVYRNQGSGIALTKSSNCVVVNNTCVENGFNASGRFNGYGVIISALVSHGSIVANNIFYNNSKGGLIASLANQTFIDFNLYHNSTSAIPIVIDAANNRAYATVKDLAAITNREKHGVEADPHFADSTDYHLMQPSSAINAGIKKYLPLKDYSGVSRDTSSPDIGAYEYSPHR